MTRRCSVMRMPVAAQRASMPEAFSADVDFSAVIGFALGNSANPPASCPSCSATAPRLGQVAPHQKGVQLFSIRLPVIPLAAPGGGKAGPLVKPPRRLIVFLNLQENGADAAAGKMTEMCQ